MKSRILIILLLMSNIIRAESIFIKANVKDEQGKRIDQYSITVYDIQKSLGNNILGSVKLDHTTDKPIKILVGSRVEAIQIEITAPGYNKFSTNIDNIHWDATIPVNLNTVTLSRSNLPYIVNILPGSVNNDKVHSIDITFNNQKAAFLIKQIIITSKLFYGENSQCSGNSPNTPTFDINDQADVNSVGKKTIKVDGSYQNGIVKIPVIGEIGLNDCGHYSYLKMTLAANSQIAPGYVTLTVKLPTVIKLIQSDKQKATVDYYRQVQTIDLPDNVASFKNLNFEFSTDLIDMPIITEQYSIK